MREKISAIAIGFGCIALIFTMIKLGDLTETEILVLCGTIGVLLVGGFYLIDKIKDSERPD